MIPKKVHFYPLPNSNILYTQGQRHLNNNIFVSSRKKKMLKEYKYLYIVKQKNSTLCFFLKDKNYKKWEDTARVMLGRITFMRKLVNNKKELLIWIWTTNWKKKFPKKCFREDNINSGSTTLWLSGKNSKNNGEICLWRTEEIFKVLLHEIIHSFRLDSQDPNPKEAYVELRAVMANVKLELLERQLPLNNYDKYIQKEKDFGIKQAKRVRKYDKGNTNVYAYLDERNRLLNKVNKNIWEEKLKNTNVCDRKNLKFTITNKLLQNYPRKDSNGNKLNIPFE